MSVQNWFLLANIFGCLVISSLLFAILSHKKSYTNILNAIFFILPTLAFFIFYGIARPSSDFISSISCTQFIFSLILGLPFIVIPIFKPMPLFWRTSTAFILSGTTIFALNFPVDIISHAPLWANQILAAILWTITSTGIRTINKYGSFVIIENISINTGILLLYFLGALPFAFGYYAAAAAAVSLSFLLYNWHPSRLNMPDSTSDFIGFILGGLLVLSSVEGAFSSVLIFFAMFFAEIIFSLMQKLTFLPQYKNTEDNTSFAKAINSGMPVFVVNNHFIRINAFLVLFGCFQAYSSAPYSLLLITIIIVAWQMYRLIYWQQQSSIKQTNKDVIQSIKKGISTINKTINPTDKEN